MQYEQFLLQKKILQTRSMQCLVIDAWLFSLSGHPTHTNNTVLIIQLIIILRYHNHMYSLAPPGDVIW